MHIDELCSLFGISRRTVYKYANRGLLDPPRRGPGAQWHPDTVRRIRLIREAKNLAVTLTDLAENPGKYFGRP
jgi:DNA-binding transcriptional MerR regulator